MIFADKLIQLRKKSGWSQEELAEQMNVTRQSVSKWEGAQSIPDLEKMIRLSELFGVSTDYLLKDSIEEMEGISHVEDPSSRRCVSMEEANAFLAVKAATAGPIAFATFLCILSPICLIVLGAFSEIPRYGLGENVAAGIGLIVLIAFVASAVAIFITSGTKTVPYEHLEKEIFETAYGVSGMVKERKEQYRGAYTRNNVIGTCLCIASVIPLFVGLIIDEENDLFLCMMLAIMLIIVGIGVQFFIRSGIIWASYEKLLQEGDYTKVKKERQPVMAAITTAYWLIVTAIYLSYSFITGNWKMSWIVWAVAGVLYPAVMGILNALNRRKE